MTLFPVLVDVYHKEQLVTKEEAEEVVATDKSQRESKWAEVTVTRDVDTATRIADILDKYGFNDSAQHIRGISVCSLVYVYKFCT